MKLKLTNILKYSKAVYWLYFHIMTAVLNLIKCFCRTDSKLIVFNSFAGRKFDDSPRAIYEAMKVDSRFSDYKLVWAFHQPGKYDVPLKIKTDGLKYFITILSARVWVTNSTFERGLSFTGKNTLYFNTWHGTPMKRMGKDVIQSGGSFKKKGRNHFDVMMSQGQFETEIFSRAFHIPREKFLEIGLPRNDILANYTEEYRRNIRSKLEIPEGKKCILYCPTYREYDKNKELGVVMAPPMNLLKWEQELGDNHVLLIRAHYEVSKVMNIEENSFVRNMTDYPNINDLYIAADILLSDYSSVFFDYSITGKPMLHFCYDYEKYSTMRGLYFDIREKISGSDNEDDLIRIIENIDKETEQMKTVNFRRQYVSFYGTATNGAVDYIAEKIMR